MHKRTLLLILLAASLGACSQGGISGPAATPFIITATLPPTPIPSATLTPIPPTPTATTVPVDGMTTTQVNVRLTPSTAGTQLTILPPFAKIQIVGKDAGESWYMILYRDAPDGIGWVTAQYVNVILGKDKIPVVGGVPTQGPNQTPGTTATGEIIQQVNVRKGPGTEFDALGTLNPQDTVTLTGKDSSGAWFQIQYVGGLGGLGWVAAAFVDASGAQDLPIVSASGEPVGTGTPVSTATISSPTPAAAIEDNDSAQAPGAVADLSSSGTRSFIYSSDVSAPQGDTADWVQFTPHAPAVSLSLSCAGNSGLALELSQGGSAVAEWAAVACGETRSAQLEAGNSYLLHISFPAGHPSPAYVRYTLRIELVG